MDLKSTRVLTLRNTTSRHLQKKPFGSAEAGVEASVVFHKKHTVKAPGSVKRYAVEAANNPERRENTIGFRVYWIAVAIKDEGTAAIISG